MDDLLESIAELGKPDTVAGLVGTAVARANALGFAAVYLVSPIGRDSRDGRILTNQGFDDTWARAYRRWLHRTDPLPEIILDRAIPFRWSEAAKLRELTSGEARYLKLLEQRGMMDGLAIPVFGPTARCGMVGLGHHPNLAAVSDAEILALRVYLQMAYLRYCELISLDGEQETALSSREKDVLLWMSRGKSNAAIAVILDISADTVDTYVRRIFKKFDVADRIGAVMAAVRHGYVIAARYPKGVGPGPAVPDLPPVSPKRVTTES